MNFDKVTKKIIINNTECREFRFQQIETKWQLHKIHLLILIL